VFFFGIFGLQSKEKELRDINNITCKKCGRISVYNNDYDSEIVCPKCRGIVDSQFSYCPHCGQKL
jgi:RNA polymerase subunit RPABC4/transcription elongation factor Spt4